MAKCEKLFQTEVTTHMAVCDPRQRGAAVALSVERIHRTKSVWLVCGNGKLPCNRRVHNEKHFTRLFVCLLVFCSVCWQRFGEFNSKGARGQRQRVGENCLEIFVLSARAKHPGRKHRLFLFLPCAKEFCYRGCVGFLCVCVFFPTVSITHRRDVTVRLNPRPRVLWDDSLPADKQTPLRSRCTLAGRQELCCTYAYQG